MMLNLHRTPTAPYSERRTARIPATSCGAPVSGHDGLNPRLMVVGTGHRQAMTLCAGCAEQIALMTDVRSASVDGVRVGYASDAFRRDRGTVSGSLLTRLRGMVA